MVVSLLFNQGVDTPAEVGEVTFDATLSENHTARSNVTSNPTEQGIDISDHIQNDPREVTIEGFVTNTPIDTTLAGSDRVQNKFDLVYEIREQKRLVNVVSELRTYSNMAIKNISAPKNPRSGDALRITITLREVRTTDRTQGGSDPEQFEEGETRDQAQTPTQLGRSRGGSPTEAEAVRVNELAEQVL